MSIHQEAPFVDWVIATLRAGGLTVGDSSKPASVPTGSGYAVVYSIAGGSTTGTIDNPQEDATPNVQMTCNGKTAGQARWLVDEVKRLLMGAVPADIGTRRALWVEFVTPSTSTQRDDDTQPPNYWMPVIAEFGTTPLT